MRYQKTANGVTTTFYLDGNKILGETRTDGKELRYFYDIDGLCGIRYGKNNYVVVRNAYGDVVLLVKDRNVVAQYYYDAWGNCEVLTYENDDIGDINPFRWKGHYYDTESKLYYANGSYYDPETGLHLDASSISSVIDNAFELLALDRNGIMCDNVLAYLPYVYSVFTTQELSANPLYDPDANKPWWELAWNAVVNFFAPVVTWFANLDPNVKMLIGVIALALAAIITAVAAYFTGGGSIAIGEALKGLLKNFIIGLVSELMLSIAIIQITRQDSKLALPDAVGDAVLFGGVFTFVFASAQAIKIFTIRFKVKRAAKRYMKDLLEKGVGNIDELKFASAVYDKASKKMYYGTNEKFWPWDRVIDDDLIALGARQSCAETQAISSAIKDGAKLKNLYVYTIKPDFTAGYACMDCTNVFGGRVAAIFSGLYRK